MFPWSSGVSQQQSLRQHSQADTLVSKYRQSSHHVSMVLATCVSASQRNPVCQLSAQPLHHLMFTFNYVYSGQHFKLNASPNYKTKSYLCQQCPLLGICVHSFFFFPAVFPELFFKYNYLQNVSEMCSQWISKSFPNKTEFLRGFPFLTEIMIKHSHSLYIEQTSLAHLNFVFQNSNGKGTNL